MNVTDKVIIEVSINENQMKKSNPHVAYTPEEIALDCKRVYDAGAAVVHYHARDPETLINTSDVDINLDALRRITEATPLLAYPTYGDFIPVMDGYYQLCSPVQYRYVHFVAAAESDVPLEIGPIDLGAFYDTNAFPVDAQIPDASSRRVAVAPSPHDPVDANVPGWKLNRGPLMNNGYDLVWLTRFCEQHGLHKSFAAPDTMALLNLRNLIDMGLVDDALLSIKLFFLSDRALETRFRGMLALARELFTDRSLRWTPVVQMGNGLPLAEMALAEGGDVRIGIGDYHYAREGAPSNAELVERVVGLIRASGREPATPDEARVIKGIIPA